MLLPFSSFLAYPGSRSTHFGVTHRPPPPPPAERVMCELLLQPGNNVIAPAGSAELCQGPLAGLITFNEVAFKSR